MTDETPRARRLFAGIALDDATRAACADAARRLEKTGAAAAFEDPAKYHLTLAFLGNVEAARCDLVVAALNEAARGAAPFALQLDKLGAFPHERNPRVIYVGARDAGAAFRALCAKVRAAYAKLGFSFDDDAVAHVTIARTKEPRRPLPLVEMGPAILPVASIALFESHFDRERQTSRYTLAAQAALLFRFSQHDPTCP